MTVPMVERTIPHLIRQVHELAASNGWHDRPLRDASGAVDVDRVLAKLALIHSEVSEAVEEIRNGNVANYPGAGDKPEGLAIELADTVIRIMDLCGALGIDLEHAIALKHEYNRCRSYRHGGKRA